MANRANPTAIGAFVIGAIALAVAGVIVFGSGQYFRDTNEFVMYFPGSINGLAVGAPVKFKGVDIGQVSDIRLVLQREDGIDRTLLIPVYVQTDPAKITIDGKPLGMDDPKNLQALVERGLRAQLQSQSLVTGLLFVQIDFFPNTPITYALPQPSDPLEIPTLPTTLEQASSAAREIIDELRKVKFGPMVQDASEALDALKQLLESPELRQAVNELPKVLANADELVTSVRRLSDDFRGQIGPLGGQVERTLTKADEALEGLRSAAGSASTVLAPGSPLEYDLRRALSDVSDAARALAQLADYLERNPSALIYGKQPPPGAQQ